MKIRIKGNSLRIRLTKPEVEYFGQNGYLEEKTEFGNNALIYALKNADTQALSASFEGNKITMLLPAEDAKEWVNTNKVGIEGTMPVGNDKSLYLLLEKDFKCLDEAIEDQSDNYDNPLAAQHK